MAEHEKPPVDTRTETVLAYAEVQESLEHGAVADLLRALVAERDAASAPKDWDEDMGVSRETMDQMGQALLSAQKQADAACEHKGGRHLGAPLVGPGSTERHIICDDCHWAIGTQSTNTEPRRPKGQKRKV